MNKYVIKLEDESLDLSTIRIDDTNIDNIDHIDNIDNLDNIDHIDNIDNLDNIDNIDNMNVSTYRLIIKILLFQLLIIFIIGLFVGRLQIIIGFLLDNSAKTILIVYGTCTMMTCSLILMVVSITIGIFYYINYNKIYLLNQ
jgi:hypothetical protein